MNNALSVSQHIVRIGLLLFAAIAIFGDAANASGDLHNALNFAGVFKPACVFVCREDGRSSAVHGHHASHDRAIAYGLATARVDGSDGLAVLGVVRAALARAALGKGATLIEAVTLPVTPGDDPHSDPLDPLARLRRVLEREKLLDPSADASIARDIRAAIDAAVTEAERAAPPARSTMFDDVYAEVPAHLEAQKAQKESSPWRR